LRREWRKTHAIAKEARQLILSRASDHGRIVFPTATGCPRWTRREREAGERPATHAGEDTEDVEPTDSVDVCVAQDIGVRVLATGNTWRWKTL
jgi:hypothetical protein